MTRSRDTASIIPTVDAKGDLLVGTADNTIDNLSPGTNGQVLTANSATATGLAWSTPESTGNFIINGAFDIWQRGDGPLPTAINNGTGYTADRWQLYRQGYASGVTVSKIASDLTGFSNHARVQRESGNTSTSGITFANYYEDKYCIALAGKPVTLSFWIRKGSGYSGADVQAQVYGGTSTVTRRPSGFANSYIAAGIGVTPDNTWQRFSVSGTIATTTTQWSVEFTWGSSGTAGTNDYIEIAGVQLEEGTVATPFRRNAPSIQAELAACQRYYVRCTGDQVLAPGFVRIPTMLTSVFSLPVEMRTTPTIETNTSNAVNFAAAEAGAQDFTNLLISKTAGSNSGTRAIGINATNPSISMIDGRGGVLRLQGSTAFVGFIAEL